MSIPPFLLCDYFNKHGKRVERLYIAMDEDSEAANRLRAALKVRNGELLLDVMRSEANISGAPTNLDDAALALNALLGEIEGRRVPVATAMQIASIGINFQKAVTVAEVIPSLEASFGGNAVCWVRGIFRHLNLGTPHIQ